MGAGQGQLGKKRHLKAIEACKLEASNHATIRGCSQAKGKPGNQQETKGEPKANQGETTKTGWETGGAKPTAKPNETKRITRDIKPLRSPIFSETPAEL